MARPLRIEFPGAVYHVISRGNERRPIVRDDRDREMFVEILARVVRRFGWKLYEYVLLTNHYHLFFRTPAADLSRGMHMLNQLYAEYFNWRHSRVGHLFQGRFKAHLVDTASYFREVARYVVLNPVRAGMRKTAGGYSWSSYRATAGLIDSPDWLATDELLDEFDRWDPESARAIYRTFVAEGKVDDDLWDNLVGQLILGSESYVAKVRALIDDQQKEDREYPQEQRFVGRPTLEKVLAVVSRHCELPVTAIQAGHGGLGRMFAAGLAVDEAMSTQMPVARALGLRSPSRISTLAAACRRLTATSPELRALHARMIIDLYPDPGTPLFKPPPPGDPPGDAPF